MISIFIKSAVIFFGWMTILTSVSLAQEDIRTCADRHTKAMEGPEFIDGDPDHPNPNYDPEGFAEWKRNCQDGSNNRDDFALAGLVGIAIVGGYSLLVYSDIGLFATESATPPLVPILHFDSDTETLTTGIRYKWEY